METQEIAINQDTLLAGVQKAFSECYPFLKIDFFEPQADVKTAKSLKLKDNTPLKQLDRGVHAIDISDQKTIEELSHDFEKNFGVDIQVSRKSGKTWNLISVTASWTLKSQNAAGEFICKEMAALHQ